MALSQEQTYSTQNSSTSDTVPSAAERLYLAVRAGAGAGGGDGEDDTTSGTISGGSGANGGEITGELPVSGGESVTIAVGAAGSTGDDGANGGSGGSGGGSPEVAGASGGDGNSTTVTAGGGGGGGGASAVDVGGTERAQAGGGGGGGGGGALEADGDQVAGGDGGDGGGSDGSGGSGGVGSSGQVGSSGGTTADTSLEEVNTATNSATSAEVVISVYPVAFAPSPTAQADGSVDLSWTAPEYTDTLTLHRSTTSGFTADGNNQIADVTGSTSYTDTGAPLGDEVFYKLVASSTATGVDSDDISAQGSDITAPPDVAAPTLDASVEDELTASWADSIDEGNFDLQARESNEAQAWGTTTDQTFAAGTTSYTITGLEDGEQYDVRLRARSGGYSGDWAEVADVTLLPADTGLTVTDREA